MNHHASRRSLRLVYQVSKRFSESTAPGIVSLLLLQGLQNDGWVRISEPRLAQLLGLSLAAVSRNLHDLKRAGFIQSRLTPGVETSELRVTAPGEHVSAEGAGADDQATPAVCSLRARHAGL